MIKRKQAGNVKYLFCGSKDEFTEKAEAQMLLFNAEHKSSFVLEKNKDYFSIGLGRAGHGAGIWYEPIIIEKNHSIIMDGKINLVSWHDDNMKWWQNLMMGIVFAPLYIVLSPLFLCRLLFSPLISTPKKQLKKFMIEYMDCLEIRKEQQDGVQINMAEAKKKLWNKDKMKQQYKDCFDIVKKHIDELDPMGLFEMGCPSDEYECEVADIVLVALKTTNINKLADRIIEVFDSAFSTHFLIKKSSALETAAKIIRELHAI